MPHRLPPLNALRAFEAAARHLSFTRAAEELHVTPAAVSQQVASLERYLGVRLFERHARSLRLTEAGRACLPEVSEGFRLLARGVARVREVGTTGPLVVSVAPAFAGKWLVPRLDRFAERHPQVDVEISARYGLPDFGREEADVAIDFSDGRYPQGLHAERLFGVSAVPLCSPSLVARGLREPKDLARFTLLHDEGLGRDTSQQGWASWLRLAGVEGVNPRRGPRFSHTTLALEAAADGQGVVLAIDKLAEPDLAAGRLVIPFDIRLPLEYAYYLVCPRAAVERPKVAAFRAWLLEEVAEA
ncbi:transcriptional regulator GcvA [Inmirania thermothiophila]|uniref:LysR family transcriptional regulator n=1 Tax=Inmirania thermothiophila TaxID=1750597 RepID=A0A3N1Y6H7_9GAMM|nr:transcriptional regulator GcvA [Inmirania thermothiophila]ROR34426.1 LysR family transcriptional regulator [Inmirania thermothiophila]